MIGIRIIREHAACALAVILGIAGISARAQTLLGWPRGGSSTADKIQASPLLTDLDGDGKQEIIVPSLDDRLYVYNHDGSVRTGWPQGLNTGHGTVSSVAAGAVIGTATTETVVVTDDQNGGNACVKVFSAAGTQLSTTTLANSTDASGKATACLIDCKLYLGTTFHSGLEVLVRDGDGLFHILSWKGGTGSSKLDELDGTTRTTCAVTSYKDRNGAQLITPSVAAVELTTCTYAVVASSDSKIYRYAITSASGTNNNLVVTEITPRLSVTDTNNVQFLGSPALADLDGNGSYEIIASGSNNKVYVWDGCGSGVPFSSNWPQTTGQAVVSSPAVAAIDPGTSSPVIVVGSNDRKVYAWRANGTPLPGWPVTTNGQVFASPVLAETDGQPGLEVFVTSLDGYLYGWSFDGTSLPGWPKRMNTPIFSSPAVGDLHTCGRQSVVFGGYDGRVFVFDLARRSIAPNAGWRQFRGGPLRQGHP